MKKRKTPISSNMAQVCEELRKQRRQLITMAEAGKTESEACKKYPPCIVCGKEGPAVRKCFFPIDYREQQRAFGSTFALAICPRCFGKALEEDRCFEIVSMKDIGILTK